MGRSAELSRLCDSQVAVLVSAPNRKSYYSFSPTSVDAVLDSFLAGRAPERVSETVTRDAHRLTREIESLEGALRRATEFRKAAGGGGGGYPWESLRRYEESITTVEELHALHECLTKLRARSNPAASSSCTVSNVVSPAFSGRDDVMTASTSSTFLELDPVGCPQPGSSWMSYSEIGLDNDSTDFVDSLRSDSNPNLEFLCPGN